mmetsp:Transcript_18914/g.19034  ORF Transcript_18914/g.19034 Transcript_18914/m.19034 type:complete len:437 (-) Transcript_18914:383-1693(-)
MDSDYQMPLDNIDEDDIYGQQWNRTSDKCNLIINYLPQDINDNALRSLFAECGEIAQAKVVRDKMTKKSLGFGFVKFIDEEDAQSAIMQMNGFPIGHKKLKVSLARTPSDDIRNCKLYVTNLPRVYTEYDVANLFSQFGDIIECRVLKDKQSGANKGVAFVQFNVRGEANRALSLHGHRVEGIDRPLIVKYAEDQHKKKEKRGMLPMPPRFRQEVPYLFPVDHLPLSLGGVMSNGKSGQVMMGNGQAYLPTNIGSPYGAAVKYGNSSQSSGRGVEWFSQMPSVGYDGLPLSVSHGPSSNHGLAYEQLELDMFNQQRAASTVFMTNPRGGQEGGYGSPVTVVVNRLPPNVDVALMQDLFSPYGRILTAHIEGDEFTPAGEIGRFGGPSRAYIQMENLAQAQNAVQALNGSNPFQREGLGPLQVDFYGRSRSGDASSA